MLPKGWKLGFRNKLLVASLLCLLLPASITLYISNSYTEHILRSQVIQNERRSLEQESMYISNLLSNMVLVSNYIQFDPGITLILKENWQRSKLHQPDTAKNVLEFKEVTEKLESVTSMMEKTFVTVLTSDGQYYSNYPYAKLDVGALLQQPWMEKARQQPVFDLYWAGVLDNYIPTVAQTSPQVLTIARNLKLSSNSTYATVIISIAESRISQIFNDNRKGQETLLIAPDGTVLASRDKTRLGQPFALADELSGTADSRFMDYRNEQYLLSSLDIPYGNYRIVSLSPYREAVSQISATHRWSTVVQIVSGAFFLLILVLLVRQFTKPVIRLDSVAARVEQGELGIRSGVRGYDEIGRLGKSFDHMLDRVEKMIEQIKVEQAQKRKAELAMLQSQINPHFLFNILNSIRLRIMMRGDEENAELLFSLSRLLRMTIQQRDEYTSLHDELHIVRSYVELLNFRQADEVTLDTDCTSESLGVKIPRFLLQPVIENAYIHGLRQESGRILIRTWTQDSRLLIAIEDNGRGMDEVTLNRLRAEVGSEPPELEAMPSSRLAHIGMSNVYERLYLTYGSAFQVTIDSIPGQGTTFLFVLPEEIPDQG
ncbi:HAMP domain-containing protein [Paenibacillus sp. LMG 31459]|uniref:HAMP domain-containing protein n=1 Tax=Paenibacillus phytohabitans TaxID=2654978 RepID=A0ABX1YKY7_9BACL|nr:histidine kinase [Paenibacillus phytohabitans]NOU81009.1 HAMP domain-containing protein [Paenibacillus phytohabitans]